MGAYTLWVEAPKPKTVYRDCIGVYWNSICCVYRDSMV